MVLDRSSQVLDGFFDARPGWCSRLSQELPDPFLVQLPVFFQDGKGSQDNLTQSAACFILNEPLTIRLFDQFTRGLERQVDRSEYDISTDAASWNIYPTQVEPEPIVTAFPVIVHPDPVSIDTNASVVVQIVGQHAKVTQPVKYFAVAIKDMELSGYRADTASSCGIGNHFLVLATIAPQRG